MKNMQRIRANEKLKRVSTLIGNGGLALLIAGVSHSFVNRPDLPAAAWIFLSGAIIWVSIQVNELLDPEDDA